MYLSHLFLENFRSYTKSNFTFSKNTTVIVGPNTSGKTNILEAIYLMSLGKSFRTDKDLDIVRFGQEFLRVYGKVNDTTLEIMVRLPLQGERMIAKKFLVNGVSKRRIDFSGNLTAVLFSPLDLELISGSPSIRREFLDLVLEQIDSSYRIALLQYQKGLRQRNALLEIARESGSRNERQFGYWDEVVIENGAIITKKREEFINFINSQQKDIFDFAVFYDKSIISKERLLQYKQAEVSSAVTLVGPHRDDFRVDMFDDKAQTTHDVKFFGSRGEQRLTVLQLKFLQLLFIEKSTFERPLLLLDDIFSELDSLHIHHVISLLGKQQTILTTTHKEFINQAELEDADVIELKL